jgi:transcriptional regulator with XRE-family HTH domain
MTSIEPKKKKTKGAPDDVDIHVGSRLRVRRTLLGMSQDALADSVGITFQQIQKYERGANRISASRLFQFSKILEVPISFFYEQLGIGGVAANSRALGLSDNQQEEFAASGQDDVMARKETLDLIRAYYSVENEDARKDITKFIKSMAEKLS